MATAEELNAFLEKRGYSASVEKQGNTFIVGVRCRTVSEVASLLASIDEPGRFVVSIQFSDILELLTRPVETRMAEMAHLVDKGYRQTSRQ